jgi:hypothetical protein
MEQELAHVYRIPPRKKDSYAVCIRKTLHKGPERATHWSAPKNSDWLKKALRDWHNSIDRKHTLLQLKFEGKLSSLCQKKFMLKGSSNFPCPSLFQIESQLCPDSSQGFKSVPSQIRPWYHRPTYNTTSNICQQTNPLYLLITERKLKLCYAIYLITRQTRHP